MELINWVFLINFLYINLCCGKHHLISGIKPDDGFYELESIIAAIKEATGFTPGIECNVDPEHNSQLYQIYMCVDTSASEFIQCPKQPKKKCASTVQFPRF